MFMGTDPIRAPNLMIFTRVARPRHSTDRVSRGRRYAYGFVDAIPRRTQRRATRSRARRIGLTLAQFDIEYPNLIARGFPAFDPDTP
jgi:hypothetical protein